MNKLIVIFLLLVTITLPMTIPMGAATTNPWELWIIDRTGEKTLLNYDQLLTMPTTSVLADLYCYGALVTTGNWTGVKISDLLNSVNADTTTSSIRFTAQDGYTIAIPMETGLQSDVILAYSLDSYSISETLRLVIPEANGEMWIALVTSITVSDAGAPNIISKTVNPVLGMNLNQAPQSSSQGNQPTSQPSIKPSTPNPTPTLTPVATPLPTNTPTNSIISPSPQTANPIAVSNEILYITIVAVIASIISTGLIVSKRKRPKT